MAHIPPQPPCQVVAGRPDRPRHSHEQLRRRRPDPPDLGRAAFRSASRRRSSRRRILPVVVSGSSGTNSTSRGYSWAARRVFTKPARSAFSASAGGDLRPELDEGLHDLGADLVGHAHDADHGHGGVLHQAFLDLARPDAVAARGDDVVVAALEEDVAILVDAAEVAGQQPVAGDTSSPWPPGCASIPA